MATFFTGNLSMATRKVKKHGTSACIELKLRNCLALFSFNEKGREDTFANKQLMVELKVITSANRPQTFSCTMSNWAFCHCPRFSQALMAEL